MDDKFARAHPRDRPSAWDHVRARTIRERGSKHCVPGHGRASPRIYRNGAVVVRPLLAAVVSVSRSLRRLTCHVTARHVTDDRATTSYCRGDEQGETGGVRAALTTVVSAQCLPHRSVCAGGNGPVFPASARGGWGGACARAGACRSDIHKSHAMGDTVL